MKNDFVFGFLTATAVAVVLYAKNRMKTRALETYAARFPPGSELKSCLLAFAKDHRLKSGIVITCVGSCDGALVRMANASKDSDPANEIHRLTGKHEIVSLVGTIAGDGQCHLHVSLADGEGRVIGGHLVGEMYVFTTAEVVLGECGAHEWDRQFDPSTGFNELVVNSFN
mmetsp:Transcript_6972/g.11055  ORF Transcript_6972/g.11055 Transcript_6972/m.11055 type:complete len:170 (+) Transcript_6972:828-1337(+)